MPALIYAYIYFTVRPELLHIKVGISGLIQSVAHDLISSQKWPQGLTEIQQMNQMQLKLHRGGSKGGGYSCSSQKHWRLAKANKVPGGPGKVISLRIIDVDSQVWWKCLSKSYQIRSSIILSESCETIQRPQNQSAVVLFWAIKSYKWM